MVLCEDLSCHSFYVTDSDCLHLSHEFFRGTEFSVKYFLKPKELRQLVRRFKPEDETPREHIFRFFELVWRHRNILEISKLLNNRTHCFFRALIYYARRCRKYPVVGK